MATKVLSYAAIFDPLKGGGYQVIVPALPEVITVGRTLAEARLMAKDSIRSVLESMVKGSLPLPEKKLKPESQNGLAPAVRLTKESAENIMKLVIWLV